jgi:Pyruvate:ferredoxin oxidoreductase and related 2-oxoacid:ferredoxin oxidoreductases, gamma subunit
MIKKIICSGAGGQGVLTVGMIIAHAAASQDLHITWVPEYGSEMRGGTASCKVKISDNAIGSPFVQNPDILVAMNENAIETYGKDIEEDGCIIYNSSIITEIPVGTDYEMYGIPAYEIAREYDNTRGVGIAIIGGVFAYSKLLSLEAALNALTDYFEHKGIDPQKNIQVFQAGYVYMNKLITETM